jgi:pilus assembly protein TadC
MTVRRAWEKMAYDYQNNSNGQVRYVYEEMLKTCSELQSGISERDAYERFGKRCNTKEYIKLSSLLAQNVKKGSKDIIRLLEQEASAAFFEHKNLARKKGEEAGTKLLIPMIMMLAVVMVIVLFPAMTSFTF